MVGVWGAVGVMVGVGVMMGGVFVGAGVGVLSTQRSPLSQVASKTAMHPSHEPLTGAAQLVEHWQQAPGRLYSYAPMEQPVAGLG